jgi:hypothetical protein
MTRQHKNISLSAKNVVKLSSCARVHPLHREATTNEAWTEHQPLPTAKNFDFLNTS